MEVKLNKNEMIDLLKESIKSSGADNQLFTLNSFNGSDVPQSLSFTVPLKSGLTIKVDEGFICFKGIDLYGQLTDVEFGDLYSDFEEEYLRQQTNFKESAIKELNESL